MYTTLINISISISIYKKARKSLLNSKFTFYPWSFVKFRFHLVLLLSPFASVSDRPQLSHLSCPVISLASSLILCTNSLFLSATVGVSPGGTFSGCFWVPRRRKGHLCHPSLLAPPRPSYRNRRPCSQRALLLQSSFSADWKDNRSSSKLILQACQASGQSCGFPLECR